VQRERERERERERLKQERNISELNSRPSYSNLEHFKLNPDNTWKQCQTVHLGVTLKMTA